MVKIEQHNEDGRGMVNFDLCVLNTRVPAFIKSNVLDVVLILANFENVLFIFTLAQKIDARASNKK